MITCDQIKHRWGEASDGSGPVEIYYSFIPNGDTIIHKRNPIPPDKPSITPPDRVGLENGWCTNEYEEQTPTSNTQLQSTTTTSGMGEPGMGSFFLLVLVVTGSIAAFQKYKQHSDKENLGQHEPKFFLNPFTGNPLDSHTSNSSRYTNFLETGYPPLSDDHSATGILEEVHPQGKASELAGYGGNTYETTDFKSVSELKPSEISTETRLKKLETGIETILKRLEISETDTPDENYFDLKDGATKEVVVAFCKLVVNEHLNPKGTEIIKRVWGVKPGGSKDYKAACELRDQLANRLKEFGSHE